MAELVQGHRRGRQWRRVAYGVHVPVGQSRVDDLLAWSTALPVGAAFTHLTSARLRGWWLPSPIDQPEFVATLAGNRCPERTGLLVTRHKNSPRIEEADGVPVTTAGETLLAAARDLGLLDLVLMGDSALRLGHCTLSDLARTCAEQRAGVRQFRHAVALLDPRSESAWESVMRVLHRAAEIPVEPQRRFENDRGQFVARADLWVVGTNRIHEYDGELHRDLEVHRRDLRRDRALVEAGLERLGFTANELLHEGGAIIVSADRLLGRGWDPSRLRRWTDLVADSLYGPRGRARVLGRWARAMPARTAKIAGRSTGSPPRAMQPSRNFREAG